MPLKQVGLRPYHLIQKSPNSWVEKLYRMLCIPERRGYSPLPEVILPLGAFPIFLSIREKGEKERSHAEAFGVNPDRTLKCQPLIARINTDKHG